MSHIAHLTRRAVAAGLLAGLMPGVGLGQEQGKQAGMKISLAFGPHMFGATLSDTSASRELLAMLPLDLTIEDYSTNEKIAYLPHRLADEGREAFGGEAPGDVCYYAPWGNLVLYHAPYRYSRGLVRLGRLDAGVTPLLTRGTFPLRIRKG